MSDMAMFHQLTTIAYQVAASLTSSLPTVLKLSNFGLRRNLGTRAGRRSSRQFRRVTKVKAFAKS
jgi:hypothetical protein